MGSASTAENDIRYYTQRGVAGNLLRGTKEEVSGVRGQSPGEGLEAKPPEAGDTC